MILLLSYFPSLYPTFISAKKFEVVLLNINVGSLEGERG